MSKSTKKIKKHVYDFEKFLMNFRVNDIKEDSKVVVLVQIRQRPHKGYERKRYSSDFIRKYIEKKYNYNILSTKKGGMLINYNPSKLMGIYEFEVEFPPEKIELSTEDVVYEKIDKQSTHGDYIKEYRTHNNLSQKKLSEMTGIPVTRISKFENGKLNPTKEEFKTIFKPADDSDSIVDEEVVND